MDGGSDWMTLSRPFVKYVTSEKRDALLQGLDKVYLYTLLPAEVGFSLVVLFFVFFYTGKKAVLE